VSPVLVLFGPTASGKTALLESLFAAAAGGGDPRAEIISADSVQVYRGLDIGSAKPSPAERAALPHHLIDIRDPAEQFTAGDFARLALEKIDEIEGRGGLPVVSGGAGFYIRSLVLGLPESPPADPAIRAALRGDLARLGPAVLRAELFQGDPVSAARIHPNDEYRLLRALEVLRLTGRPLSAFARNRPAAGRTWRLVGLRRDREDLYRRIDERCATMFRDGLVDEVRGLWRRGLTPRDPGLRAIGYREFFIERPGGGCEFVSMEDIDAVKALVARNSRRYAKRQMTFFAGLDNVEWIDA